MMKFAVHTELMPTKRANLFEHKTVVSGADLPFNPESCECQNKDAIVRMEPRPDQHKIDADYTLPLLMQ